MTKLYDIRVSLELIDGEELYVTTCDQFPNLGAYEETLEESVNIIIDAITTTESIMKERIINKN